MYDEINALTIQQSPSTVHVTNTGLSRFFQRYLLQKAISVFEWKMPKTWAKNYFLYSLYCFGFLAVFNTDKFGAIPQACGLRGYNVMYQPTHAVITNALLTGIIEPKIDSQCVLFRLMPDYGGIWDMVSFYADMMALCAEAAGVNALNSKLSYVFAAGNKAAAESCKKMYDRVASGEPMVVVDKDLFGTDGKPMWAAFEQNVGQNYIIDRLLADLRKWELQFMTAIGIKNANTDKKERLITAEVEANEQETQCLAELWLEELQQCCEKTRAMFGIEISVDWRKGKEDGTIVADGTVPV